MISCTHRRWVFSSLAFCLLCLSALPVRGQGFLDELEKKAREGLGLKDSAAPAAEPNKNATPGAAELPAPSTRRSPPPVPTPTPAQTPGTTSSILEPPALPSTIPNRPAAPAPAEEDGIYLGLEAESLTGGGIGARVVTVTENSPAWRAGFRANDVILAIDGFAIANLDTMVDRLALRRPGDTIKVLLLRGTRNVELTAVLQSAATAQRIHGMNPNTRTPSPLTPAGNAWLGVVVADLSTAFRTQFGLRAFRAAAVTNVTKGSPADALAIQPGDAIVGADGRPIETARDLLDWMATKRPGELVSLSVMRGARTSILETTLGTDPKVQTATANRPVAPDPFASSSLNIEAGENTVPAPTSAPGDSVEVKQLRSELRAAQDQIQVLEQRLAELETMLKKK